MISPHGSFLAAMMPGASGAKCQCMYLVKSLSISKSLYYKNVSFFTFAAALIFIIYVFSFSLGALPQLSYYRPSPRVLWEDAPRQ